MEDSPLLDDYILSLAKVESPRICFVPTASGDSEAYIARFYDSFSNRRCQPTHLQLFRREELDLREFISSQDVVYVGGGNTANMLAVWRVHGVDDLLREYWQRGGVLAGLSAGSICWFESGVTDSFGKELEGMACLGLLSGSNCPHYDGEVERRPRYHQLVRGGMPEGVAADDGVALHYVGRQLKRIVSSRPDVGAYRVAAEGGEIREDPIAAEYLGQ